VRDELLFHLLDQMKPLLLIYILLEGVVSIKCKYRCVIGLEIISGDEGNSGNLVKDLMEIEGKLLSKPQYTWHGLHCF
jgi:hypothetical protein